MSEDKTERLQRLTRTYHSAIDASMAKALGETGDTDAIPVVLALAMSLGNVLALVPEAYLDDASDMADEMIAISLERATEDVAGLEAAEEARH